MIFYAERACDYQTPRRVRADVLVSPNAPNASGNLEEVGELCLKDFKVVFGFTPRKNKVYKIRFSGAQVTEVRRV